jgi:hypothetical protein
MNTHRRGFLALPIVVAWPFASLAADPDLAVGQEWSVKGATAKVIIGRIEPWGGGEIAVSVSIVDIPSDHGPITFGHSPFDKSALVGSLDHLLATGVAPDPNFEPGYQQWKSAKGGIFTISVAQAVAFALGALKQAKPQPDADRS